MNADFQNFKHLDVTESIIGACYSVYNNYLKATGIEVGLLVNFGPSLQVRRKALKNNWKQS